MFPLKCSFAQIIQFLDYIFNFASFSFINFLIFKEIIGHPSIISFIIVLNFIFLEALMHLEDYFIRFELFKIPFFELVTKIINALNFHEFFTFYDLFVTFCSFSFSFLFFKSSSIYLFY
jgi:hypothetical protein